MSEATPPDHEWLEDHEYGWLWFLVLLVPVAAFVVSWLYDLRKNLATIANPAGIRIDMLAKLGAADRVMAVVFGGGTMLALVYFAYRYRASKVDAPQTLERQWAANTYRLMIIGVSLVLLVTFMFASTTLAGTDQMPAGAAKRKYHAQDQLNVTVVGSQWVWRTNVQGINFTETDDVYVPAHTLVRVRITSADVDHSWAIESLGIKKDAIPGQVNTVWLYVKKPGVYQVNCAELCGAGHSKMTSKLHVLPKDQYRTWAKKHDGSVPYATGGNASSDLPPAGAALHDGAPVGSALHDLAATRSSAGTRAATVGVANRAPPVAAAEVTADV